MPKAICEDCGSLVEAELTHNGVCPVGHYVHCGWGHQLSPDDLISDATAIEILTEQLEAARADAKEAEAYAEGLEAKLATCEEIGRAFEEDAGQLRAKLEKAVELLKEARQDLEEYVTHEWPKDEHPVYERKWERDMELCRRIDATLAEIEGEKT